jgi:AmpD protein
MKTNSLFPYADYIASPNCDERPLNTNVDLLVLHGISWPPNEFDGNGVEQLFTNTFDLVEHPYFKPISHLRVSSHLFIRRQGRVIQFVPFEKRAWHAGDSSFEGRTNCNDFSIGIELEGTDTLPYEKIQYEKLAIITQTLMSTYPGITLPRIVGHSDIAPSRKTDPGEGFDWKYFRELLG